MLRHASWRPCQLLASSQQYEFRALHSLRRRSSLLGHRAFQQSRGLASRTKKKSPTKASPYKLKVASYESATGKLARLPGPTLLYHSQSNLPYVLGCYFIGGVLITCAIINNHTKNASLDANVAAWVPVGVAIGQFTMVAFGGYLCLRPQNLVKSIRAIPSTESGSRSVLLQIERSKSVPFVTPRTYTVPPRDITMSAPLFLGGEEQVKAEVRELRRQQQRFEYLTKEISPLTHPFRVLGYWTSAFYVGVKKAFTSHGLITFHVRGNNLPWKMETEAAWALEDGRSLDEIVRIKEV